MLTPDEYTRVVQFSRELLSVIADQVGAGSSDEQIAHLMADLIEQDLLPDLGEEPPYVIKPREDRRAAEP